jgi:integrase
MYALAVELLLIAPMRVDNLVGLEMERHLLRLRAGSRSTVHLAIPAAETKNSTPYELELPAETLGILELYLSRYRGRIAPDGSTFLFPNESGGRRSTVSFATGLSGFILRETGIRMNVHLFRHLAAKLHLEACPEDIETMRRILGHRNISTTLRSYTEVKTAAAFRRYDSVVASWREPLAPVSEGPWRRTKAPTGARR